MSPFFKASSSNYLHLVKRNPPAQNVLESHFWIVEEQPYWDHNPLGRRLLLPLGNISIRLFCWIDVPGLQVVEGLAGCNLHGAFLESNLTVVKLRTQESVSNAYLKLKPIQPDQQQRDRFSSMTFSQRVLDLVRVGGQTTSVDMVGQGLDESGNG